MSYPAHALRCAVLQHAHSPPDHFFSPDPEHEHKFCHLLVPHTSGNRELNVRDKLTAVNARQFKLRALEKKLEKLQKYLLREKETAAAAEKAIAEAQQ